MSQTARLLQQQTRVTSSTRSGMSRNNKSKDLSSDLSKSIGHLYKKKKNKDHSIDFFSKSQILV